MANFLEELNEKVNLFFDETLSELETLMLKHAFNWDSGEDLLSAITCKYSRLIENRVSDIVKTYNECPDVVLGNVFYATFCISEIDGVSAYVSVILEKNADGIWEYSHIGKIEWQTSPFKTRMGDIVLTESHMAICSENIKTRVETKFLSE